MRHRNKQVYNWLLFAQNYLKIAELGCREMLYNKHRMQFNSGGYTPKFTEGELLIPTLYNLRHSIELFIKMIEQILTKQNNRSHDIHKLFIELKRKL